LDAACFKQNVVDFEVHILRRSVRNSVRYCSRPIRVREELIPRKALPKVSTCVKIWSTYLEKHKNCHFCYCVPYLKQCNNGSLFSSFYLLLHSLEPVIGFATENKSRKFVTDACRRYLYVHSHQYCDKQPEWILLWVPALYVLLTAFVKFNIK